MSARYRITLGIVLGLLACVPVLSILDGTGSGGSGPPEVVPGPLLSDCGGAIRELVIHYASEAADVVVPTYRDFLRQLSAEVTVQVVCPDAASFADLCDRVGPTECKLSAVTVDHPITCWSRDRWLALGDRSRESACRLLRPRGELGADTWPARQGDARVADDLAAALGSGVTATRSELFFDGGDFVADDETVFVTPAVLLRNLQRTVATREELVERLAAILQRKVVLLREAPEYHAGMYMMAVGDRTILLGDPAAAEKILAGSPEVDVASLCLPEGPDFSAATIARLDAVAEQCREAGYRVVRVPIVPGRDGRTYLTYLNVILEERDAARIVYMPVFSQVEPLNRAAEQVWSQLGYEVHRINCDACHVHFGSLRCLVNVLRRG
ncbi:MAG: agmatine deiminase family protein [Candidatus Nealsonbacteria bacterium]|nr:agmatine deiminase family protein [Candidatus Nealsonbacteria bacterium]